MRRLLAPLVAVLALSACHHAAPTAVATVAADAVVINGVQRGLGYDVERYRTRLAALAHPQSLVRRAKLPAKADLRPWCAPVYDQGNANSCTAFSLGKGLREYWQRKRNEQAVGLSALWLYYKEREHMGPQYVTHDGGANLVDGTSVLMAQGCAPESLWPYKLRFLTTAPSAEADAAAGAQKLTTATQLKDLEDIKTAVAAGKPAAFGFVVTESIHRVGPDGVMPVPASGDSVLGGHAVLAVGYDDARQLLTVRNSWGDQFGDHGYFYMPYSVASDPAYMIEIWTAE